ncbi:hypothetical protein [Aeoliella mucimassa]|uniref:Oligosaccharide repeat unit polymerase n=1 Tax=Aeoliella mucimassa TaxID=2527972 RepID=A0A518AVT2_9BACT|nr:hypothetical protein [Aeoliella mucimassa]QDU58824.1 hypothetical protein Pan181_50640 [Aeoliella mucimassa]
MNPQDETLGILGLVFMVAMALLIVIPYLRGKADLLTSYNLFLFGSFIFTGLSAYAWSNRGHYLHYEAADYTWTYIGYGVFYAVFLVVYNFVSWPRKMAGRLFRTWCSPSFVSYFVLAVISIVLSGIALLQIPIPVISQLSFLIFVRLGPFAVILAIMAFRRDAFNPLTLLLVVLTITPAFIMSLAFGGGRRIALSLLFALPVVVYWTWLRYKKPKLVLPVLLVVGIVMFGFNNGLEAVRHRDSDARGLGRALETIRLIATQSFTFSSADLALTAQDSVEVTLFTVHNFVGPSAKYEGKLFAAPYFVLVNPIPRTFWEDKPKAIGFTLPQEVAKKEGMHGLGNVNWGVSPAAQGFHDGGMWVIALYAVFFGLSFRYLDEWLVRQPDNPFLLGFLASSSANIVGMARGSIDIMSIPIISSAIAMVFLAIMARMFFGSDYIYPRTDQVKNFPLDYLKPQPRSGP